MKSTPKNRPINVAILAFETWAAIPIIGPMDILNNSCALWREKRGKGSHDATFDIQLVSLKKGDIRFGDAVTVHPHASISTAKNPDMVLVPSLGDDVLESLALQRGFIPWIKTCSAAGARLVSMCTGSFLLAESGVLDGRSATTHWFYADLFRRSFPKVNLCPERMIVDEGSVITAGAATSFLDLILYLMELYCGREAAILTAKVLLIEMGRHTQLPYTIFSGRKMHDDKPILRAQQFMETNLSREIAIEVLAKLVGMSVRNFDRRFRAAVDEAPSSYVQKLRIEKAKRLLETTNAGIAEIMLQVGYEDERSFRRLFHVLTQLSPKGYRRRYGARAVETTPSAGRFLMRPRPTGSVLTYSVRPIQK
jgi:transcriptional regulator GlxA family with amidase domain